MLFRFLALLAIAPLAFPQADTGELRISIADPSGLAVEGRAEVASKGNQYVRDFDSDPGGHIVAKRLPFGRYTVRVTHSGFAPASKLVEIRSAVPLELKITLGL